MTDVLSTFKDKYVEEIAQRTPLSRIVVLLAFVFLPYGVRHGEYQSVWNSLLHMRAAVIWNTDQGLLANLFLFDFAVAFGGLAAIVVLYRALMRRAFSWIADLFNLSSMAEKFSENSSVTSRQSPGAAILLAREEERSIELVRTRIRRVSAAAELSLALAASSFAASFWGNALDIGAGVTFLTAFLVLSFYSIRLFVSRLLPRESHLRGLYGGMYTPDVGSVLPTQGHP
ncbi:hypothetical protein MTYP_02469 [Methylophilaceae bacterium]|nr:hypothetical protein MTYP_02469 [Methylophilaceae bacterium]